MFFKLQRKHYNNNSNSPNPRLYWPWGSGDWRLVGCLLLVQFAMENDPFRSIQFDDLAIKMVVLHSKLLNYQRVPPISVVGIPLYPHHVAIVPSLSIIFLASTTTPLRFHNVFHSFPIFSTSPAIAAIVPSEASSVKPGTTKPSPEDMSCSTCSKPCCSAFVEPQVQLP